jgi:hypothetical protein
VINQLQTYQHISGYLPDDNITREIYWSRFLKMKHSPPFDEDEVVKALSLHNSFDEHAGWREGPASIRYEGRTVSFVNDSIHSNGMYEQDFTQYLQDSGTVVRIKAKLFAPDETEGLAMNLSLDTNNTAYHWSQWRLEDHIDPGEWEEVEFYMVLPKARGPRNTFKLYFVNGATAHELYIDEISIDVFQPR